ncbi:MAG: hypothetical protein OXE02_02770 [Chloroflexi bacterium]|nr:hypothetical protein [Chloroflexota bacterium]
MEQGSAEADAARYVEDVHGLRLTALLEGLVREHDVKGAAEYLGVDVRTLATCLRRRRMTDHVRAALNLRLAQERNTALREETATQVLELAQQVGELGARVTALAGVVDELRSSVAQELGALREEQAGVVGGLERRLGRVDGAQAQAGAGSAAAGNGTGTQGMQGQPKRRTVYRQAHPKVVTAEPEHGEEEVYGDAEPLVIAWREARGHRRPHGKGHAGQGGGHGTGDVAGDRADGGTRADAGAGA